MLCQKNQSSGAVVTQVPDDGALGVVDGLAAADDLSHPLPVRLRRPVR